MICKECPHHDQLKTSAIFRVDESQFSNTACGLMTQHHLKGLAYDVAKSIQHPVVVLQKVPGGCTRNLFEKRKRACGFCENSVEVCPHELCGHLDAVEKYARLDVMEVGFENSSPLCQKIRNSNDPGEYDANIVKSRRDEYTCGYNLCRCYHQDCMAAGYFLLNSDDEKARVRDVLGLSIHTHSSGTQYIRFTCPYTGYTECAFEIRHNGLSVVLLTGQILVDDDTPESKENMEKHEKLAIQYGILPTTAIENSEFIALIDHIFEEICIMTEHFESMYITRTHYFINRRMEKLIQEITKFGLKQVAPEKEALYVQQQYSDLKASIRECINDFAAHADIEMITCFMTEYLDEQMGAALMSEDGTSVPTEWFAEHQTENQELIYITEDSERTSWLKGMDHIDGHTHVAYLPEKRLFNIVVLVQVKKGNFINERLLKTYGNFLKTAITAIRGIALGFFYRYQADKVRKYTKDLRHELGQSNVGFLANIATFNKVNWDFLDDIRRKKVTNIIKNAKSYSYITMLRTDTSRYMNGMQEPKKLYFLPYSAFLFKWGEVYYDSMESLGIKFRLLPPSKTDRNRPFMFADPGMIEQVAYNLTNNAMKYGLPGTAITLDCRLNESRDMYQLVVKSYGLPMKDEAEYSRVFDRGFQGSNAIGEVVETNIWNKDSGGIGLAVSWEIADKHGGTLALKHEKISDYCVPVFTEYQELYDNDFAMLLKLYDQLPDIRKEIKEEAGLLAKRDREQWKEMNAVKMHLNKENITSPYVLHQKLISGTVQYTFILSIPHTRRKK